MDENILGREKISKLFVKYSLPAMISMVIAGMQTVIDGIFVGNVLGPNSMASVNIASPFVQVIIALAMIISIGSQSYMGLSLGAKDIKKTENIFRTSIISIICIGSIITLVGMLGSDMLAKGLGASEILMSEVATYIQYIAIYTIPMSLMFLLGFSGRIIEKPELYFYGSILSVIVNIVLDYLLIYELQLGVLGAATATGIAYSSGLLVVVWPMISNKNVIGIFKGKFDKSVIGPIMYNGSSEGINAASTAISAYLFNMAFMNLAGEIGVAAFTAINYIAQFGIMLMFGVSDGIGPIVSYNYGAKEYSRVDKVMSLSDKVLLVIGSAIFIILFFFGENIVKIFVGNDKVILELAAVGAKIYAFAFLVNGFNIVNSGYFTYIDKPKESAIVAAARGLIFIGVGIFTLPFIFGSNGIWMTIPFAEIVTIVVVYLLRKKTSEEIKYNTKQVLS